MPIQISDRNRYISAAPATIIMIRRHLEDVANMQELTDRNRMKELITILMESPFYLKVSLEERRLLIKKILEEYHFLSHESY